MRQFRHVLAAPLLSCLATVALAQGAPRAGGPPVGPDGKPMGGVPVGTLAPDGLGATTAMSPSAAAMALGPWEDAATIKPLPTGATIPARSVVQTVDGKSFDLNAAVAMQPTVLVFYRGGWCPYCSAHLRDLQKSIGALRELGYQLLAVSTDTPAALRATMSKEKLDYQLLSDSQVTVAKSFGLTYKVVDSYLAHVKNDHQTDLVVQNGGYLLTPAVYVLNKKGEIRFLYANNNYTVRLKQDILLKAARDALK